MPSHPATNPTLPHPPICPTLAGFIDYMRRGGGICGEFAAELVFELDENTNTLLISGGQRASVLATHARIQALLLRVHDYWYWGNTDKDIPIVELVLPEPDRLH